ncbi:MAG TPA: DNA methyltransferase [Gemmataceae bacterium]|nr:DNA methyltransferase [Gemmataceae bacterium]
MKNNPLPRLDTSPEWRARLLPHCRLKAGDIWQDPEGKHRVGCLDATDAISVAALLAGSFPTLAIQDPPYNLVAFERRSIQEYIEWSSRWVRLTHAVLAENASLYVWLGADQNDGFQPLADFMVMMRGAPFAPRSFITMRNQRGYGTQKNWMAVRQEVLYYVKGTPQFNVEAEYTDILNVGFAHRPAMCAVSLRPAGG